MEKNEIRKKIAKSFQEIKDFKDISTECSNSDNSSQKSLNSTRTINKFRNFVPKNVYFKKHSFQKEALNLKLTQYLSEGTQKQKPKSSLISSYYRYFIDKEKDDKNSFEENKIEQERFQNLSNDKDDLFLKHQKRAQEIFEKILTTSGCTFYQKKIMNEPKFANDYLYPILTDQMLKLVNDKIGHYLYQQFLEVLTDENFIHFIKFVDLNFMSISFSENGSKVMQKLIENMDMNDKRGTMIYDILFKQIKGNVFKMSIDENCTHIIQKIIKFIEYPYNNFVFDEIYQFFLPISTTKFGCCVIQKALLHSKGDQQIKIINLTLQNTYLLILNQFGNYICQCLINLNNEQINLAICSLLSKDLFLLCKEKYSSNVIEKLFDIQSEAIIERLAKSLLQNDVKIIELICNQYGNYIIQKLLNSTSNKRVINKLLIIISLNVEKILKKSYGKKLFFKLINIYPILKEYVTNK